MPTAPPAQTHFPFRHLWQWRWAPCPKELPLRRHPIPPLPPSVPLLRPPAARPSSSRSPTRSMGSSCHPARSMGSGMVPAMSVGRNRATTRYNGIRARRRYFSRPSKHGGGLGAAGNGH